MVHPQNRTLFVEKFDNEPFSESAVAIKTMPVPACGEKDVLIRMKFACINPSDMFTVQGIYPGARSCNDRILPAKLGFEGAGIVYEVGSGVKGLKKGDKVFPFFDSECGSYSDFHLTSESNVIKLPNDLPLETASQLLVNPVTVVAMLDVLGIKEGEILLQSAANSTLGRIMIQVCAMRGIKTLNIIRRPELADELLALGGDFVVVSHDDGKDISKQVSQILKSKGISTGIKYAIDPVGGLTASEIVHCLEADGTLLLYGLQSGKNSSINAAEVLFKEISIKGFWLAKWLPRKSLAEKGAIFKQVIDMLCQKKLIPPVEKTFALDDFKAAFKEQLLNEKGRTGKLLFDLSKNVDY